MDKERVRVLYLGRVQGVGFRFTTEAIASKFDVTGYVKNLSDGRVELVAESDSDTINSFLNSLQERMGYYISNSDIEHLRPTGEFSGFTIRF